MKPTPAQTLAYQGEFDYFNDGLFGGTLPEPMLMFDSKLNADSRFVVGKWMGRRDERCHEISLNPALLKERPIVASMALAFGMTGLWQHSLGTPSRRFYHNREFAAKLESIGLRPTANGESDGKRTGQKMSCMVIPSGAFDRAFRKMPEDLWFPLATLVDPETETARTIVTYRCAAGCPDGLRGVPGLRFVCSCAGHYVQRGETPDPEVLHELFERLRDLFEPRELCAMGDVEGGATVGEKFGRENCSVV